MTKFLARVANADEAVAAIAGGADVIGIASSDRASEVAVTVAGRRPLSIAVADGGRMPRQAADFVEIAFDGCETGAADRVSRSGLIGRIRAGNKLEIAALDRMARNGLAGAMLETGDDRLRLLDIMPVALIERFVDGCRERGLQAWLSGRLESPDVPRLLPIKPSVLCFREALLDAGGKLDPNAVDVVRGLIPRAGGIEGRKPSASPERKPGRFDKLFVRDLVLSMSVGAYAQERERPQRVRFNVDAEIHGRSGPARDMRDVFSYDLIVDTIRKVAAEGHVDLLETLAERIAGDLLVHPDIARLTLRLEKLDVGPAVVGIEIIREPLPAR